MVIRSSDYRDTHLMQTTIRPLDYNSYREYRYSRTMFYDA